MTGIDPKKVAKRYNDLEIIIDNDDEWHLATKKSISTFLHKTIESLSNANNAKILNAGSAGYSYGLDEMNMTHVDVADKHLVHLRNAVVASIDKMPFSNEQFDLIICVGSVLNYCDPIAVMKEFSRVLKTNGHIILEFEQSRTFELLFKKGYNQSALFVETFFDAHGDKEHIWYFSEDYITRLIASHGWHIKAIERFHILSPLFFRLTRDSSFAARFSKWDKILSYIPWFRKLSSNVIYHISTETF